MDYSLKLNKELPDDIRVLAWCTVPADFSARHASCLCNLCAMQHYQKMLSFAVLCGIVAEGIARDFTCKKGPVMPCA